MPETRRSTTNDLPFTDVLTRLSRHEAVDGLVVIGSALTGDLSPSSDYDLVIVLSDMRVPLHVGVTSIDGRFADLVFCTMAHVERFLTADEPLDFATWEGRLVGWFEEGEVFFDRFGRLQEAQTKACSGSWIREAHAESGFAPWNGVNYNLAVVRRYLRSDNPLYLQTADIRMMLYGPSDLFFNYFTARGLRWAGEKAAIRHLQEHDPDYLDAFTRFLAEQDRNEKFRCYEKLAARTVAPVGDLWRDGDTVMIVDAAVITPEVESQALEFWEELMGG